MNEKIPARFRANMRDSSFKISMTKEEWKHVKQVRLEVVEEDGAYSYPINIPRWLFNLLNRFEV